MQENDHRQQKPNEGDPNIKQEQKKKIKRAFSLKPEHFETKKGLQKLYELTNQIKWDDNMTVESAMNLVTVTLTTWHYNMVPKYSFQYFIQRCQALGSQKFVNAYLNKVRRIHKGVDVWQQSVVQPAQGNKQINQNDIPIDVNFQSRINLAQQLGSDNIVHNNQIDEIMDEDLRLFEQMNARMNGIEQPQQGQGMDLGGEEQQFDFDYPE